MVNTQQMLDKSDNTKKPENLDEKLKELEDKKIAKRREIICGKDNGFDKDSPRFGLALSGGDIRSATFCLGVLRGLARNGVLRRFDYLSTVSGGGYIGAALGCMYQRLKGPKEVEDELKKNDSSSIKWLRFNGRYLTPAGAEDWGILIAAYLRSWLAIQWEFFVLATLLCSIIILPHVLGLEFVSLLSGDMLGSIEDLLPSPWFGLALIVLALAGPWQLICYWQAPHASSRTKRARQIGKVTFAVVMVIAAWLSWPWLTSYITPTTFSQFFKNFLKLIKYNSPVKITIYAAAILGSCSVIVAMLYMPIRRAIMQDTDQIRQFRNERTKGLRKVLVLAFIFLLFGFLDRGSWELWQYIKKLIEESIKKDKPISVDLGSILVVCHASS